jgi:hypothetical protein
MKQKQTYETSQSLFLKLTFIALIFITFVYVIGKQTYINYKLENYGICTKAKVVSRNSVGSKGTVSTKYSFIWKNQKYFGSSTSDDKYQESGNNFLTDDDLITGDTIIVVFLESNPEINRSNSIVEKDCDCIK